MIEMKRYVTSIGLSPESFKIIVHLCRTIKFQYIMGHKPSSTSLENQVLMTLKLREKIMNEIPSQLKNQLCSQYAFTLFRNCRGVFDCTKFRCERPWSIKEQELLYSKIQTHIDVKSTHCDCN